jgi:hypothetical protein
VFVSVIINSTTQLSPTLKTRIMKYIESVNDDKTSSYETIWWSVSIIASLLLSSVAAGLAYLNFKEWNPWERRCVIRMIVLMKF